MSSFSSSVISLGSEGPVLAAAVSRMCATTGPCLRRCCEHLRWIGATLGLAFSRVYLLLRGTQ